jgi:sulfite exporter TauE/SafE
MCGPLQFAVAKKMLINTPKLLLIYHLSRIAAYLIIGGIFFAIGETFQRMIPLQNMASILAGCFLLLFLASTLFTPFNNKASNYFFGLIRKISSKFTNNANQTSVVDKAIAGFFNGLLPCGAVYFASIAATSEDSLIYTLSYMTLFGVGTMIPLFIAQTGLLRFKMPSFMSVNAGNLNKILIVLLATILILRGLELNIPYLSPKLQITEKKEVITSCGKDHSVVK